MAAQGVTDVCLTPHLRAGQLAGAPPAVARRRLRGPQGGGAAAAPAAPRRRGDARPAAAGERRGLAPLHHRRHPLHPGRVSPDGGVRHGHHRARPRAGRRPLAPARPPRAICLLQSRGGRRWRELGARMQVDATTLLSPAVARAAGAGAGRGRARRHPRGGQSRRRPQHRDRAEVPRGAGRRRAGGAAHGAESAGHPGRRAARPPCRRWRSGGPGCRRSGSSWRAANEAGRRSRRGSRRWPGRCSTACR